MQYYYLLFYIVVTFFVFAIFVPVAFSLCDIFIAILLLLYIIVLLRRLFRRGILTCNRFFIFPVWSAKHWVFVLKPLQVCIGGHFPFKKISCSYDSSRVGFFLPYFPFTRCSPSIVFAVGPSSTSAHYAFFFLLICRNTLMTQFVVRSSQRCHYNGLLQLPPKVSKSSIYPSAKTALLLKRFVGTTPFVLLPLTASEYYL